MLAEDHSSSVTELAARADILTASAPKPGATVAAAPEEEAVIAVAAVATAQPNRGRGHGNFQRGSFQHGGNRCGGFQHGKRNKETLFYVFTYLKFMSCHCNSEQL